MSIGLPNVFLYLPFQVNGEHVYTCTAALPKNKLRLLRNMEYMSAPKGESNASNVF